MSIVFIDLRSKVLKIMRTGRRLGRQKKGVGRFFAPLRLRRLDATFALSISCEAITTSCPAPKMARKMQAKAAFTVAKGAITAVLAAFAVLAGLVRCGGLVRLGELAMVFGFSETGGGAEVRPFSDPSSGLGETGK